MSRLESELSHWLGGRVDAGEMTGGTLHVRCRDQAPVSLHAGSADYAGHRPTSERTIYRIYSMSKPVIALATLLVLQRRGLGVDTELCDLLPEFTDVKVWDATAGVARPARCRITLHHLLTHTAGFTYGWGNTGCVAEAYRHSRTDFNANDGPLADVVSRLSNLPLMDDPGDRWHYGVSFDVLGRVLEVIEGRPLDQVIDDVVVAPLGVADLGFVAKRPADLADLCRWHEGDLRLEDDGGLSYAFPGKTLSGGAGMLATASAYADFIRVLAAPDVGASVWGADPSVLTLLTSPRLEGDLEQWGAVSFNETTTRGVGFGYGGSVVIASDCTAWKTSPGEYAWGGYASTAFWIDPVRDVQVVFMTQVLPSDANAWRAQLREIVARNLGTEEARR